MSEDKKQFAPEGSLVIFGVYGTAIPIHHDDGSLRDFLLASRANAAAGEAQATSPPTQIVLSMDTPSDLILGAAAPPSLVGRIGMDTPADVILGIAQRLGSSLGMDTPSDIIIGVVGPNGRVNHVHRVALPSQPNNQGPIVAGSVLDVWEDDPANRSLMQIAQPDLTAAPALSFIQMGSVPAPGRYLPGTDGFRYWMAADALRRAATFWDSVVQGVLGKQLLWQTGTTLPVVLNAGEQFNAYYDRQALNFFHGPTPGGTVYTGESADIVCHELGHAVLDAIKPELFDAASTEAAAFHEAFADLSAIFTELQVDVFRLRVLEETRGNLRSSSRLSRLAEQLGAAIRWQNPHAAEPDCLRNAVNSFVYEDPLELLHMAPAGQLSSEPHSFSRVFTGAFFEALADVFAVRLAHNPPEANEFGLTKMSETLRVISRDYADLLVRAIVGSPVVSNFFAQVAAELVRLAKPQEASLLRDVFVRRAILSMQSAVRVHDELRQSGIVTMMPAPRASLAEVVVGAHHYGVDLPLRLQSPGQDRPYEVHASGPDASPTEPASALTAARSFVDDVFRRGRIHDATDDTPSPPRRFHTHVIEKEEGGQTARLRRICFDCGLRWA